MSNKVFVGCDPGAKGAITILDYEGKIIMKFAFPRIKDEIDYLGLVDVFNNLAAYESIHFCIEDVHSIFGASAKSNFSFGHICGFLQGMLCYSRISHTMVQPKLWQKEMWAGFKPIEINTGTKLKSGAPKMKVDTKATSLIVAKRLFPSADFRASERSTNPHDGIVDSALLAEYCRRKFK